MDQVEKLLSQVFDITRPVVYFPIRHHSPGCTFHIRQAIEIYKPDCILVEGPSDTDSLLPFIGESEPPVAIYYSYQGNACYYPMQSFSPELVAVRAGLEKKIPVHFIDLPLGNLVAERDENLSKSWYDDYYLERSKYIEALCAKENCRSHNELWEKLFEMPALDLSTEEFIKNLLVFCYYSRVDYPEELELEEQNKIREMYMAENILKHMKKHPRILVITGGFHTAALMALVEEGKPDKIKPLPGQAYLIPYSYKECDQLTGYASGMPHPSYYHDLYRRFDDTDKGGFRNTTLVYIAKLAANLRKNKENVSLSEEAAAFAMCQGLASLRDKSQPGVYEFLDGVQSAFVKGELNLATSFIMSEAVKLLRGEKIGVVAPSAPVPPIVVDFLSIAKSYKMNTQTTALKTITLDIVSKPRHRNQSVFLHRLAFLDNSYGKKTYGPDYVNRTGTKLVREKWNYAFTGLVIPTLIEKSHKGGTVEDACESILSDLIRDECHTSGDAAALLLQAGLMALMASTRLVELVRDSIREDSSFVSLADCIRSLAFLEGVEHILRLEQGEAIAHAKYEALMRLIPMISSLTAADEKTDFNLAEVIKMLHQSTKQTTSIYDMYRDALLDLTGKANIPPALDGAATGLLYDAGQFSLADVLHRAKGYFSGTDNIMALTGRFLRGIFLTAKDVLFYDSGFIEGINNVIGGVSYDEFIELVPDLRLAFTSFTPREIDRIGKKVLEVLGIEEPPEDITTLPQIDENQMKTVKTIDAAARGFLYDKT
ncbi:MAG: DUF5682 family protein [Defluviitaleaceae bacterium]|nr:DUF5682 family protein [Defluviitaleaceae bacterium]